MSNKSNDYGRAFEYACIEIFYNELLKIVKNVIVTKNSSFFADQHAWNSLDEQMKNSLILSASAVFKTIADLEPLMIDDDGTELTLYLQSDKNGEEGDVRDLVISKKDIKWEIGLSLKHNHFAVKHSRLSKNIDFGNKWFKVPCSEDYWNIVLNIFEYLELEKKANRKWSEISDKDDGVYVPLLEAFRDEIIRSSLLDNDVPKKLVEYLLGEYDFYKAVSIDIKKISQIQTFNLHGTLNKPSKRKKPIRIIPIANLPTRIVNLDFKPGSKTTLELYMDGGWQFSFRIHNASTIVEPSLKFDIQIIGMPVTILTINSVWN